MYCPVIDGYRNLLVGHLQTMSPTLNSDYLEQLSAVPWEEYNEQLPKHRATRMRRALFCGSLVTLPAIEWRTWSSKTWTQTLRSISRDRHFDIKVDDENMQRVREDLNIMKAEYLLTRDRGSSQVRGIEIQRLTKAVDAACRVIDRVHRYVRGDTNAATMVGTNTFVFLQNLSNLVVPDYMEFLHQLHYEVDDGKS
jgi:hypothetical protein